MVAANNYVKDIIRSWKRRPSKYSFGDSLLYAKEKDGSRKGVMDCRALNRMIQKNSTSIPIIDAIYDSLVKAGYFSKLYFKYWFH